MTNTHSAAEDQELPMVERVARAICEEQEPTPWGELEESGGSIPTRDDFRAAARAAIAAMREPSAWMIDSGTPHLAIAEHAWRAMVDAALGEGR